MDAPLTLDGIAIDVVYKAIRNLHLRIRPPEGRVTISAPKRMPMREIRLFATERLDWIRTHREAMRSRAPLPGTAFVTGELHPVWGVPLPLLVTEAPGTPRVEATGERLVLQARPGTEAAKRGEILEAWYRAQVRGALPDLVARWEPRIGVKARGFDARRMRSRWGSCSVRAGEIRLSSELARRPREFLEYVVVHELVHLLEASHGDRFRALMDRHLPGWREIRGRLNRGEGAAAGGTGEAED